MASQILKMSTLAWNLSPFPSLHIAGSNREVVPSDGPCRNVRSALLVSQAADADVASCTVMHVPWVYGK